MRISTNFRSCLAVAQRIERFTDYGVVAGSNPASETTSEKPWELVTQGFFVFHFFNLECGLYLEITAKQSLRQVFRQR